MPLGPDNAPQFQRMCDSCFGELNSLGTCVVCGYNDNGNHEPVPGVPYECTNPTHDDAMEEYGWCPVCQ